ncbi:type II secretion system F family protein, partial [Candidatus Woesearchaeota archaeon]|nr:type II secretion system F family protein [Candidatus Woesearchaeota archaeon]
MANRVFKRIARNIPGLATKLKEAGINQTPEEFVKKTAFTSFYMTTGITMFFGALSAKAGMILGIILLLFPVLLFGMFFYFLKIPDLLIIKKEKEVNKEIVFAGRFLIIELESGVSLYNAIRNVTKSYNIVGKYFNEIIEDIDMGTPIEDALNKAIEYTPSSDFRKVLWQMLNSIKTGADIAESLKNVVEQVTKRQIIEIKKYGKKLNPLAMFYMMIAVIIPSIGTTMIIVLSTFVSFDISLSVLLLLAAFLGFIQFMFISIIRTSRPS